MSDLPFPCLNGGGSAFGRSIAWILYLKPVDAQNPQIEKLCQTAKKRRISAFQFCYDRFTQYRDNHSSWYHRNGGYECQDHDLEMP